MVGPGGDPGGRRRACLPAVGLGVPAAGASSAMQIGVYDEGQTFFGDLNQVFATYKTLHVGVLRVNLYWGGKLGVAKARPFKASDPRDAAYDWTIYDRTAFYAAANGIQLLFSITGTPRWANGGQSSNRPPTQYAYLRAFAYAAAARYSGTYVGNDGRVLPAVHLWAAWNEPNNPTFLRPQFVRRGGKWVIAERDLVRQDLQRRLRGRARDAVQGREGRLRRDRPPREQQPRERAPVRLADRLPHGGQEGRDEDLRRVRAQPVLRRPDRDADDEAAGTKSGGAPTAITLANINLLIAAVTRLYGRRAALDHRVRLPDEPARPAFGVSWTKQARYLTQAFAIARKNPRIDHDALVPRQRRAEPRRLAVGPDDDRRAEEAVVQRVTGTSGADFPSRPAALGRAGRCRRSGGRRRSACASARGRLRPSAPAGRGRAAARASRLGQLVDGGGRDEEPVLAVGDDVRHAADPCCDDRAAARQRLDRRHRRPLVRRRAGRRRRTPRRTGRRPPGSR